MFYVSLPVRETATPFQISGHRGEQEWRVKKTKKQRIDPEEDLHLQDLTHPEPEVRDDFRDEKERKKHNKVMRPSELTSMTVF